MQVLSFEFLKFRIFEILNFHPCMLDIDTLQLVVHVGVSGYANELTIEQQAHNHGYERLDVKGCTADDLCCVAGADEILIAGIDMKTVCEDVNNSGSKAKAEISFDPGRYALARSFLLPIIIVADRISQQLFYLPCLHGRQVYFFYHLLILSFWLFMKR